MTAARFAMAGRTSSYRPLINRASTFDCSRFLTRISPPGWFGNRYDLFRTIAPLSDNILKKFSCFIFQRLIDQLFVIGCFVEQLAFNLAPNRKINHIIDNRFEITILFMFNRRKGGHRAARYSIVDQPM